MKTTGNPVRTTLFAGLIFSLVYAPLSLFLESYMYWPWPIRLPIFLYLIIYALLLTRWHNIRFVKIVLPIFLLFVIVKFQDLYETKQFIVCVLLTLSWIRSGICAEHSSLKLFFAELTLSFGGAVLAVFLSSPSPVGISLTIWLFFLFQSLYYLLIPYQTTSQKDMIPDRFEEAKVQMEKLLDSITE